MILRVLTALCLAIFVLVRVILVSPVVFVWIGADMMGDEELLAKCDRIIEAAIGP